MSHAILDSVGADVADRCSHSDRLYPPPRTGSILPAECSCYGRLSLCRHGSAKTGISQLPADVAELLNDALWLWRKFHPLPEQKCHAVGPPPLKGSIPGKPEIVGFLSHREAVGYTGTTRKDGQLVLGVTIPGPGQEDDSWRCLGALSPGIPGPMNQ